MTTSEKALKEQDFLHGQLLIAMPNLRDGCFDRSVVLIVSHDEDHAMGLIINRQIADMTFKDVIEQLEIEPVEDADQRPIYFGGPVETKRGMVLHTNDYQAEETIPACEGASLTATVDILKDLNRSHGGGPAKALLCLGHAGWSAGQLESELAQNAWLNLKADPELIFAEDQIDLWQAALARLGIEPAMLSADWGDVRDPETPLN